MKKEKIEHLEFIYNRLKDVHQEKENIDYMNKFRKIIDKLKHKTVKPQCIIGNGFCEDICILRGHCHLIASKNTIS